MFERHFDMEDGSLQVPHLLRILFNCVGAFVVHGCLGVWLRPLWCWCVRAHGFSIGIQLRNRYHCRSSVEETTQGHRTSAWEETVKSADV